MSVSMREFYCYSFQLRETNISNILKTGRLAQQYQIDMYIKIETQRLEYLRFNQPTIEMRAEAYQTVVEALVKNSNTLSSSVGKYVMLGPRFTGGPRDMRKRFMNALAVVALCGIPDFFITMTCNPKWWEILSALLQTEKSHRADLLARVFKAKIDEMKKELLINNVFGVVAERNLPGEQEDVESKFEPPQPAYRKRRYFCVEESDDEESYCEPTVVSHQIQDKGYKKVAAPTVGTNLPQDVATHVENSDTIENHGVTSKFKKRNKFLMALKENTKKSKPFAAVVSKELAFGKRIGITHSAENKNKFIKDFASDDSDELLADIAKRGKRKDAKKDDAKEKDIWEHQQGIAKSEPATPKTPMNKKINSPYQRKPPAKPAKEHVIFVSQRGRTSKPKKLDD